MYFRQVRNLPMSQNPASIAGKKMQQDSRVLPAIHVTVERLEEFRRIYKKVYGEEITLPEASEMAHRLVALYQLLQKPLPGEHASHPPSQQPPAQTSPEAS